MTEPEPTRIGSIENSYGGLVVKDEGGKCYWAIEGWAENRWEEIPRSLYEALLAFEANRHPA